MMATTAPLRSSTRVTSLGLALVASLAFMLAPQLCHADDGNDRPSMFSYGISGFGTGAQLGLATGFLATGPEFEEREWRTLLIGTGVGAVAGVGVGVILGLADSGRQQRPGYFVLRDMGYGASLGALTGAAVGALVWASDGEAKDVLTGAAIGTLAGAGVGIIFGIVEGANASSDDSARAREGLRLSMTALPAPGGALITSAVSGAF